MCPGLTGSVRGTGGPAPSAVSILESGWAPGGAALTGANSLFTGREETSLLCGDTFESCFTGCALTHSLPMPTAQPRCRCSEPRVCGRLPTPPSQPLHRGHRVGATLWEPDREQRPWVSSFVLAQCPGAKHLTSPSLLFSIYRTERSLLCLHHQAWLGAGALASLL